MGGAWQEACEPRVGTRGPVVNPTEKSHGQVDRACAREREGRLSTTTEKLASLERRYLKGPVIT